MPWFTATYIGFGTFFDAVNILGNQAGASDPEKIGWVCRYAGAESEYWELIDASPEPNSTFTAFQDQVCALYPELDPARCFSYHDLKVLVRHTKTCTDRLWMNSDNILTTSPLFPCTLRNGGASLMMNKAIVTLKAFPSRSAALLFIGSSS